jgi:hypothetical protein
MISYVALTLLKCGAYSHHSKALVAIQGVYAIMLSFLMSFGLTAVFGILFSSVTPVCGFLLLAVGTDDVFIITTLIDQVDPEIEDVPERVGRREKEIGGSGAYSLEPPGPLLTHLHTVYMVYLSAFLSA